MTARQFSDMLRGRKIGKDKYSARCPHHPDKHPSLQIAEGRKGVLIRCMSAGCDTRDILGAMGLDWSALFHEDRNRPDPEILRQIQVQQELDARKARERKDLAYEAIRRAYVWDECSGELARLLIRFPDDDRLARLYHRSLDSMRRCERIAQAYYPKETWGNGIVPSARHRWPTQLKREDLGNEISNRIGLA